MDSCILRRSYRSPLTRATSPGVSPLSRRKGSPRHDRLWVSLEEQGARPDAVWLPTVSAELLSRRHPLQALLYAFLDPDLPRGHDNHRALPALRLPREGGQQACRRAVRAPAGIAHLPAYLFASGAHAAASRGG